MAGAGSCVEEKTFDEVDEAIIDGAIFNSDTAYFVKNDPEAKTYRKALKKYEKAAPSGFSATTFATIMTLKTIGDELGDGLSAQAVLDTLKNADGIPVFLAQPMNKADAATLAGVPINIYNPWQRIVRLKNGKVVDANDNEWIRG
jgi:orotate phosphoribosyltransferase-like protein